MPMAVGFLAAFIFRNDSPSLSPISSNRKPKRPVLQALSRALPIFSSALSPFSISMEPSKKIPKTLSLPFNRSKKWEKRQKLITKFISHSFNFFFNSLVHSFTVYSRTIYLF
ncbi:hypothetical protein MRB53_006123 [Persea americana]|uniref:Uncharacterized protein n=1 Tax=Persea americana TaxID=3435 RepID=A0ACC2MG08_PERAE|nr:hypothetical protein MRB53_006123 [Persea americana]